MLSFEDNSLLPIARLQLHPSLKQVHCQLQTLVSAGLGELGLFGCSSYLHAIPSNS